MKALARPRESIKINMVARWFLFWRQSTNELNKPSIFHRKSYIFLQQAFNFWAIHSKIFRNSKYFCRLRIGFKDFRAQFQTFVPQAYLCSGGYRITLI